MRRAVLALSMLVLFTCLFQGVPTSEVAAQQMVTLRIATLAPRGSAWMRNLERWDRTLRRETGNRLGLRIYGGGAAGDERTVIRKIRSNQLDGGAVTTTGLGLVVRPVLVLSAPGVIETYEQLDAVRSELAPELTHEFEEAGFKLVGWGDAGQTRLFSNSQIRRPSQLRSRRVWVWRDNPVFVEFLRAAGVTGVPLQLPEVYPALQTGMIDTTPASALAAVALQWFTRLHYVSQQSSGVVVGAMILRKDKFDALPADVQEIFMRTSSENSARVMESIRTADRNAYTQLLERGLTAVDNSQYRAEWQQVARTAKDRLAGRLFSRDLLERVERIAADHAPQQAAH